MRTRRPQSRTLTLPLAFLSAAFMLACQDQGLEPVGPEGPGILLDKEQLAHTHGGGGGDGPGSERRVTITGGLEATNQLIQVDSDNKKKFVISAGTDAGLPFTGAIRLVTTAALEPPGDCVFDAGTEGNPFQTEMQLLALLTGETALPTLREFLLRFDRSDGAGVTRINYQWGVGVLNAPGKGGKDHTHEGEFGLAVGGLPGGGFVEATEVRDEGGTFTTFTFSEGEVKLQHAHLDPERGSSLRCTQLDEVTLVVSLP